MNKFVIHTDGGARGNPGPAAIGVVIESEAGKIIHTISQTIGSTTNNVAEYSAVIAALKWCKDAKIRGYEDMKIQFFLDSALVVNQLNGLFKVKEAHLRNLLFQIRLLEQEVGGTIIYSLIPREKNWQSDRLVNKALDNLYSIKTQT